MGGENEKLRGSAGTIQFMSPECCRRTTEDGYEGKKADVWSLGCSLYAFVYLRSAFMGESMVDIFERIGKGTYRHRPDLRPDVSSDLKLLIDRMLVVDPSSRASLDEVKHHPFFN